MTIKTWLKRFFSSTPRQFKVYTDGAIRNGKGPTGLGAIAFDEQGKVFQLWSQAADQMTNNEAEYRAAILALEALLPYRPAHLQLLCDSKVLVDQMNGLARVRAPGLRGPHAKLRALTLEYEKVTFQHIPRSKNRMADALANQPFEDGM
ncbi:MAG: ribonuclease HI family protein [Anaerolineales bacterium]|nr:ribonuclease HI family protein [Anaerolineales bacterium]